MNTPLRRRPMLTNPKSSIRNPKAKTTHPSRRPLFERLEDRALMAGFNFADFSNTSSLNLTGVAAVTADNRLRLTPGIGGQVGAAWFAAEKQFVTGSFSTTFQFQLANFEDSPGAESGQGGSDGFTFAIQNTNPNYVGGGGGNLAYNGLTDSLVVEFDTFQNSELGDTSSATISIHTNGTGPNNFNESFSLGHYDVSPIFDDANVHTAKIAYQPGTLSIYLDNLVTPKLTVAVDLGDKLALSDGRAWVGFTGATGGGWESHDILNWSFDIPSIPTTLVSIGDAAVAEGNSGTTNVVFTVTRSGGLAGTTTVNWATADSSATSPGDYTAASGQLVFNPLETAKSITVVVKGDTVLEQNETFSVKLSGVSGGGITDGTGTGTILNDEVTIAISDATVTEGNTGTRFLDVFVNSGSGGLSSTRNSIFGPDGNLYVASGSTDSVLRYDGTTGAFLGAFVPSGSGGLLSPWALVFGPDGNLFVSGTSSNSVLRYNGMTGAFIDEYVPSGAFGLSQPKGLAFDSAGNLYVSSTTGGGGRVGPHQVLRFEGPLNPTPGAPLPAPSQSGADFVLDGSEGLSNPNGLAFGPDGNLYVANTFGDRINRYDATTGAPLGAFVTANSGGLDGPSYMVFHSDGLLYVTSQATNQILRYNAVTGVFQDTFVAAASGGLGGPAGLAFDASGLLYVGSAQTSQVLRYGPSSLAPFTMTLNAPSTNLVAVNYATLDGSAIAGTDYQTSSGTISFAPGQTTRTIFVQTLDNTALEPNKVFTVRLSGPSAGATISDSDGVATIQDDETLRQLSISDAVATEGSTAGHYRGPFVQVLQPKYVSLPTFGPDGNLYLQDLTSGAVNRYDGATGEFVDHFLPPGTIMGAGRDIVFHDGYMYIGEEGTDDVLRFNATTGAFDRIFVTSGSGGIDGPHGLTFGPDANGDGVPELYVSGRNSFNVVRYDGATGAPLGSYVTSGSGGLSWPEGLTFDPTGSFLYVASVGSNQVLKYNALTGAYVGVAHSTALTAPKDVNFGSDGLLYVAAGDRIPRFTASGTYVDDFVPAGSGGMSQLSRIAFGPNGDLFATTSGTSSDRLYWFGTEQEAVFTVSLPVANTAPISVNFTTANGTATAGSDYVTTSGSVTFAPGVTTQTIRVPLLDDSIYEGNETFTVDLTAPVGGTILDGQGVGTIIDNDLPPTKFYVVDLEPVTKTFEYTAEGAAVENYALNSGNSAPRGVARALAGDKVWVADANKNVYVYDNAGLLLGSWAAGSLASNASVRGIATDGTDVWLVDSQSDKVYRYAGAASRTSGSQNAASSFSLNSSNGDADDLVTDGASLWVLNNGLFTEKVFKYNLSGSLQGSWTINGINNSPTGIALDPASVSHLWIVDSTSDRIYQFDNATSRTSGSQSPSTSFALAAGNTLPHGLAVGLPQDNAATRQITIGDASTTEGSAAVFTVQISTASASPVTVQYATTGGTATSGSDFTATSGTLTFAPGQTSQTITVQTLDDTTYEGTETFTIQLSSATNGVIAGGQGLGTIADNELPPPQISISDVTATEGNSTMKLIDEFVRTGNGGLDGSRNMVLRNGDLYVVSALNDSILRYDAQTGAFISQFVASGSGGLDYPQGIVFDSQGNLYVASQFTSEILRYDANGTPDALPFVASGQGGLSNPHGIAIGPDGYLYVTCEFDKVLRFQGPTGANPGEFIDVFAITIGGGPSEVAFGPDGKLYGTVGNGIGRATGVPGALMETFVPPGTGGLSQLRNFRFDGSGNLLVVSQANNQVVRFQGPNGANPGAFMDAIVPSGLGGLERPIGITLDSNQNIYVSSYTNNHVLRYGPSSLTAFTVNLSSPSGLPVTVNYATAIGSAGASDFGSVSGTVTFAPGQISQTILVQTIDDSLVEGNETFFVNLSSPSGAVLADSQGIGTIIDDEASRQITISDASVTEGGSAIFTVQIGSTSGLPVTVQFATANGSATAPSDFAAASGTLTFAPGETTQTITVSTVNDTAYEGNETFVVNLSNPVGGIISDSQGVGTIIDNDTPPTKFYVVDDGSTNKTFEYGADGTAIENYAVSSGNSAPRGVASTAAGTMVWVADANKNVYVYNTSGGLLGSWTAGSLPSNASVQGIATNGTDVWIIDDKGNKVYKYAGAASRLSGSQNAGSSFSLNSSNGTPTGLVTDGTSIWVVNNSSTDKVFKYTVSGTLQGSWTISGGGGNPTGITIDPTNVSNIWIVDSATDRVYQFNAATSKTSGSASPNSYFALAAGNTNPQGIADPPPPSAEVALPVAAQNAPPAAADESSLSFASLDFVMGDSSPAQPTSEMRSASSLLNQPRSGSASQLASVLKNSRQANGRDDFFASLAAAIATKARTETELEAAVDCLFAHGNLLLHRLI